jgi:hypothetical protein
MKAEDNEHIRQPRWIEKSATIFIEYGPFLSIKAVYVHDYVHVNVYVNEKTTLAIVYVIVHVHVDVDVDVIGF